jgi:hypothetical protein
MSHRNLNGDYLNIPRLVYAPPISSIIDKNKRNTREVVFAEAVVETEETIIAAMGAIDLLVGKYNAKNESHFPKPIYHTLALINKIEGISRIPNLTTAYRVDKIIWVAGYGCDDGEKGRERKNIVGRLADNFGYIPNTPYATRNF